MNLLDGFDVNEFIEYYLPYTYTNWKGESATYNTVVADLIEEAGFGGSETFEYEGHNFEVTLMEEVVYPDWSGECRMVFSVKDEDGNVKTFLRPGHFQLHYGTDWEEVYEVEEKPVTRVEYIKVETVDWQAK